MNLPKIIKYNKNRLVLLYAIYWTQNDDKTIFSGLIIDFVEFSIAFSMCALPFDEWNWNIQRLLFNSSSFIQVINIIIVIIDIELMIQSVEIDTANVAEVSYVCGWRIWLIWTSQA